MIAMSNGLHLYDQYWDVVNQMNYLGKIEFMRDEEGSIIKM